jgi:hypothetical protein
MTDIERYNKHLRGNKFRLSYKISNNYLVEWFTIGDIVEESLLNKLDYRIDIFWTPKSGVVHHNIFSLSDIIRFIDNGSWILSTTYLREQKLKQLRND